LVRKEFLAPFLSEEERGLEVLSEFADMTVTRHVMDAAIIPVNTFDILGDCVTRVAGDRVFNPKAYRAGRPHGHELPKLISALLFVGVNKEAPGAARFANGNWSEIAMVMPLVTRLMNATGWSVF